MLVVAISMKPSHIRFAVGAALLVIGFITGRFFQHERTGFHFKVLAVKEYGASIDPIRWRYVSETVGMPFLDPGTTIIEYRHRTIFKAARIFQGSVPFADHIKTSGNQIDWDDGELSFHLTVEEMKKGGPANRSQPAGSHG